VAPAEIGRPAISATWAIADLVGAADEVFNDVRRRPEMRVAYARRGLVERGPTGFRRAGIRLIGGLSSPARGSREYAPPPGAGGHFDGATMQLPVQAERRALEADVQIYGSASWKVLVPGPHKGRFLLEERPKSPEGSTSRSVTGRIWHRWLTNWLAQ
jgi:hypothetical protein